MTDLEPEHAFVGRQMRFDVDGDDFFVDYSESGIIPFAA